MKKTVRVYYCTFVDVPLEESDFSSEEEMIQYANENTEVYLSLQDINEHLVKQDGESEVIDL